MIEPRASYLKKARRILIKVGTAVLARSGTGIVRQRVREIARQVAVLYERGKKVVVVSSGAIGAGVEELGLKKRPDTLPKLQATAAVGQSYLIQTYNEFLREFGLRAGQILMTREDFSDRVRYLNARNTLNTLLQFNAVPIVNENDTVSVDEIRFGDNDLLSALVANLMLADFVIVLTVVEGLLDRERVVPLVKRINEKVLSLDSGDVSPGGLGGMKSKLHCARMLADSGIPLVIASGLRTNTILDIMEGKEVGTFFVPNPAKLRSRKCWIGFTAQPSGSILIDEGARRALLDRGKSLLPSGVVEVEGEFEAGDVVDIRSGDTVFARGQTNYSASEILKIKGLKTSQIRSVLGHKPYDEVVHRDNLVLLDTPNESST